MRVQFPHVPPFMIKVYKQVAIFISSPSKKKVLEEVALVKSKLQGQDYLIAPFFLKMLDNPEPHWSDNNDKWNIPLEISLPENVILDFTK